MASLLDFVNRVRTIMDLDELPYMMLDGTVTDGDDNCLLGTALGVPIVSSESPDGGFAMHFLVRQKARLVGIVMGLEWDGDECTVELPQAVSDVAVAAHFEFVRGDSEGRFVGWLQPTGDRENPWVEMSPTDDALLPDAPWRLRLPTADGPDPLSAGGDGSARPDMSALIPRHNVDHRPRTPEGILLVGVQSDDPQVVWSGLENEYLLAYRALRVTTYLVDLLVRRLTRVGWTPRPGAAMVPAGDPALTVLSHILVLDPPQECWWTHLGGQVYVSLHPVAEMWPGSLGEPFVWVAVWFTGKATVPQLTAASRARAQAKRLRVADDEGWDDVYWIGAASPLRDLLNGTTDINDSVASVYEWLTEQFKALNEVAP